MKPRQHPKRGAFVYIFTVSLFGLLILAGCDQPDQNQIATLIPTAVVQFERLNLEEVPFGTNAVQYEVNWCGGTGTFTQGFGQGISRTVEVSLNITEEIEAQIGVENIAAIKGRIAVNSGFTVGQTITWDNSNAPSTGPGTHVIFDVVFNELWQHGRFVVLGRPELTVEYAVLVGITSDIVNSQQIPCTSDAATSALSPTLPSSTLAVMETPPAFNIPPVTISPLFEDFSAPNWMDNRTRWSNFFGVCAYGQQNEMGILTSQSAGSCSFALLDPVTQQMDVLLAQVGEFGARVSISQTSGQAGKGIGLWSPSWYTVCTVRLDQGTLYRVFEVSGPQGRNVYLPTAVPIETSILVTLRVTQDSLICLMDNQSIGSVALADLPVTPTQIVARTIDSNRPEGSTVTTLDDVYLITNLGN